MATGIGPLRERVAFDEPVSVPDGAGGTESGWSEEPVSIVRSAEFIYQRGGEQVEAARQAGTFTFKVRIRNGSRAQAITPAWRMRDLRRGVVYNVREVDAITQRNWIFLVVEGGVAV